MDDITETPTDNVDAQKTTRTRRKRTEPAGDVFDQAIADRQAAQNQTLQDALAEQQSATAGAEERADPSQVPASWVRNMGRWRDNEVGVRLEEDRQNRLHTIVFRDAPPQEAVDVLKDRGFQRDKDGGWSQKMDRMRPAGSREHADETVLEVANVLRDLQGLDPKQSYYISRA